MSAIFSFFGQMSAAPLSLLSFVGNLHSLALATPQIISCIPPVIERPEFQNVKSLKKSKFWTFTPTNWNSQIFFFLCLLTLIYPWDLWHFATLLEETLLYLRKFSLWLRWFRSCCPTFLSKTQILPFSCKCSNPACCATFLSKFCPTSSLK